MNAKDKWINDVENSINGLKPAEVNPYLYSKIVNRLQNQIDKVPAKFVWVAAGSLALLLFLNLVVLNSAQPMRNNGNELQGLMNQMQLMNENTVNYN